MRWIKYAIFLAIVVGCKKSEDAPKKEAAVQPTPKIDNNGKPVQARVTSRTKGPTLLPFKDAVILGDNAPAGELPPPDVTCNGKNTAKLYESIANDLWDKVAFTDNAGKPIRYQAIIATEFGDIHIDLLGNAAPNHVRSFVCLAKSGYYDGMKFYYSFNRKVEDFPVGFIETGCPRGTGELGSGSIGYWLRPENSAKLSHEEGVLGSSLNDDPNSAACRFYLTAVAMPQLDVIRPSNIFGKVTQGLDIVRTINRREVREGDLLAQPVLIRSVTILPTPD